LASQLWRSGTSIGANVEEAQAAQSRADFKSKMGIAAKEARETHYWLRLARDSGILDCNRVDPVLQEAEAIRRILISKCCLVASRRLHPAGCLRLAMSHDSHRLHSKFRFLPGGSIEPSRLVSISGKKSGESCPSCPISIQNCLVAARRLHPAWLPSAGYVARRSISDPVAATCSIFSF